MDSFPVLFLALLVMMSIGTCKGADLKGIFQLGSFNTVNTTGSEYHLIQHSETWHDALRKCKYSVGGNLLAMESQHEKMVLDEILDIFGPEKYWTAGRFTASGFVWDVNNEAIPIQNSSYWAQFHPTIETNSETRVIYTYNNKWSSNLTTGSSSETYKFICEVERRTNDSVPAKCYKKSDLAIVLDSSKSIGQANYTATKNFLATLSEALTSNQTSRLSFIIYGNAAKIILPLNNSLSSSKRSETIRGTEYLAQSTWTNLGLDLAIAELSQKSQGASKRMLVLTDGQSNNKTLTAISALHAAKQNITVFAIGLGNAPDREELKKIAGGKEDHVKLMEFDKLTESLSFLSMKLCS